MSVDPWRLRDFNDPDFVQAYNAAWRSYEAGEMSMHPEDPLWRPEFVRLGIDPEEYERAEARDRDYETEELAA